VTVTTECDAQANLDRVVAAYCDADIEACGRLLHEDARYWSALAGWVQGAEAVQARVQDFFARLPQVEARVVRKAAEGTTAVIEFEFEGRLPSGNRYRVGSTDVIELRDGGISLWRSYLDPEDLPVID
jgi:limonene-1,2-epoxide hydrolase